MTYVPPVEILGGEVTATAVPAILGLSVVVLIIFAFMARSSTPASEGFVLNPTPGSTVVYSLGSRDAKRDARKARARSRHLGDEETFAVLVRPDVFEIWGHGDTQARWRIERSKAEIRSASVLVRVEYWQSVGLVRAVRKVGVRITDGARTIHIIPAGTFSRDNSLDSVLRALHR